ncbi:MULTISPECIES: acetoacetate--CoA ligase [unclassified Mycobacterium]|uniref:acetoacetate--CoA ligase n=1 Tax=unclassified Mycobacterium TaxID=2642494 RepID=UPI0029C936D1|nr:MULTISPECIES: acetoacetate--CoA ligase [unclassified Mycobacterium]
MTVPKRLWAPDPEIAGQSQIAKFVRWLNAQYDARLDELDYASLHQWSTADLGTFWTAVAEFCEVKFHQPPRTVIENERDIAATSWFVGSSLNYAEHALSVGPGKEDTASAVIYEREDGKERSLTYGELRSLVAAARTGLLDRGVNAGDRVVAIAPNCVETLVTCLAAASIGAIWACCSPEFGQRAVHDRFAQLEPSVLLAVDGYFYGGKAVDLTECIIELGDALPSLRDTIVVPYLDNHIPIAGTTPWSDFIERAQPLEYLPVAFDHPLWVLYSSGTTGLPKGIVHGHGGIVVEHLKMLRLQSDLGPGDRFFWFTTTGWMMWNFLLGGLLVGATIVLYDGNPHLPDADRLWDLASRHRVSFFGVSASFIHAAMRAGVRPNDNRDLSAMRMIGSTGAPLSPAGFDWIVANVGQRVQIYSNSGGTDVCTPFVASAPTVPVWTGEISCAALGCSVEAFDPSGQALLDEVGELVITTPMPSMPVSFWNDSDNRRRRAAYFDEYPGVWRHGDWVRKTPRGSYVIYGRSDATLNRGGVRMGTAEFYSIVEEISAVRDSLVIDMDGTDAITNSSLLCFLVLEPGNALNDVTVHVTDVLRTQLSPRHVPDRYFLVRDIPRTLNGKKCEVPVKRILMGVDADKAVSRSALANPESLDEFTLIRDTL